MCMMSRNNIFYVWKINLILETWFQLEKYLHKQMLFSWKKVIQLYILCLFTFDQLSIFLI